MEKKGLTALQQINEISGKLPKEVREDINKMIKAWLGSGGDENDPYIYQQLRYAKRFVK